MLGGTEKKSGGKREDNRGREQIGFVQYSKLEEVFLISKGKS